jgi:outer membrane protein assembly factor BamA
VPVIGYIFPISKKDKVSPPSVVGGAVLFTDNGSRAAAFAGQLYFAHNTYKTTAVYARGNLNYDLYGSGASEGLKLPIKQTGQVFQAEFLRRIAWQFFLGPRFMRGNSIITDRSTGTKEVPPPPPDLGLDTALTALGVRLARDTSENRFYPMSGTYFSFTSDFFSEALGSKYSFQSYRANFSKYWNWGEKHVLAYNGYSCSTGGAPPFYGNCIYGSSNQLRGYVPGKYFDRYTLATQLEYRLALPFRLGVVGFGGIGEAIPGDDPLLFMHNDFLPAGGVGVRLLLSRQYHVNLRSDFAWGKDGHTFNLGIGEAF